MECICQTVDEVLDSQGIRTRVAGGYYLGDGILLSLDNTTLLQTAVLRRLEQVLKANEVVATVGVVLVNGWRQRPSPEGDSLPLAPPQVETMGVLELMALHRAEQEGALLRQPAAQQSTDAENDEEKGPHQSPRDAEQKGGGDQG